MKVNEIMTALEAKHPGENEYLQAVREVLESIEEVWTDQSGMCTECSWIFQ